jgi:Icc protein
MAHCLLQLSDPHLVAAPSGTMMNVPLRDSLRHVVEDAQQHEPDRVLVTGDLSHDGSPASYAALGDELAPLDAPCHGLPGNHDDKSTLADALRNRPFRSDRAVTANGWRLLLLDSAVPDANHGRLSPPALEALDDTLSAHPNRPTLISLHHSPVPVGVDWLDPINLHAPDDFRAVLERHEQVRLVLFGHVHQAVEAQWGSIDLLGCPSTCFQFTPETDSFALDSCPPGYRTVMLRADGSFDTTLHRVPVPFRADPTADGY